MIEGGFNRKNFSEIVYESLKDFDFPVLSVDVANHVSHKMGRIYSTRFIAGFLCKLL